MNARLDLVIDEARAVLSAADQDGLAELIAAYVSNRVEPADLTEDQLAEIGRRHDEPFDPASEAEVREFFERHRG